MVEGQLRPFDVTDRDLGGYVEEAKLAAEEAAKVSQAVTGGGDGTTGNAATDKAAGNKGDPEAAYIADRLEKNFRRTVFAAPASVAVMPGAQRPGGGFGRRVAGS